MSRLPPPSVRLPEVTGVTDGEVREYLNRLRKAVTDELNRRAAKTEPTMEALLFSPSGKVFRVKVDDAGVLSTEEVAS